MAEAPFAMTAIFVSQRLKAQHAGAWAPSRPATPPPVELANPAPHRRWPGLRIPDAAATVPLTLLRGGLVGLVAWAGALYAIAAFS